MSETPLIQDLAERARALALETSFVVRAPAGSGKTDLLTRRLLKLLAAVDEPEEILAITFTRAATAEMRSRVLHHLEKAAHSSNESLVSAEDERLTLARAALANSERRGWRLLEQPHRLNIETIDSLCLRIAHAQPRLSRLGGQLNPTERGTALYAQAARQTLGRLGGGNAALNESLIHLLELRDNNLPDCEALLSGMLAQRDQWVRAFPLANFRDDEADWDLTRSHLEAPFRRAVKSTLSDAHELLMAEPLLAQQLLELANYACANGNAKVALLAGVKSLPSPDALPVEHWRCLSDFLLTLEGEWRKRVQVTEGFPPGSAGSESKRAKDAMTSLLSRFAQMPDLLAALRAIRGLPKPRYDEDQWRTLRHLFTALRHAVAELRVIFAEQNAVDFTELGIAARAVLSDEEAGPDRLLALSGNIRHLLIDEFQDTSRSQHELVRRLVRAWDEGDDRTCFLVGDPMQSIYMFRQAEVELFYRVESEGLLSEDHCVACEPLQLSTNFRSHAGLTERWNDIFAAVFGERSEGSTVAVPFSPSFAAELAMQGDAVHIHPQIIGAADRRPTPEEKQHAHQQEAQQILDIIERHLPAIERAEENGEEYRVAVLVRARQHLAEIVRLLRERAIPFRAVELETLAERQELLDLLSLTRALLHPMDRIAWLSVLRAPWCGLRLADLHLLTGRDDRDQKRIPMLDLIERHLPLLETEPRRRASRVVEILKQAMASRFVGLHAASFSQWIERTWRSLGGPECVDAAGYENAHVYFRMLDAIAPDGLACLTEDFESELARLFAQPDPTVSERAGVQLMTIHKAKGLGFDVVVVPGLDRKPASDRQSLIVSLEQTDPDGNDEMLVAPIGSKGGEKHPTYAWVQRQRDLRVDEERKRLLYVACTRARRELHLLGTATMTASGLQPGDRKSLLCAAWPAVQQEFAAAMQAAQAATENLLPFPEPVATEAGLELAAAAQSTPALKLRRLKNIADTRPDLKNVTVTGTNRPDPLAAAEFARPEGTRRARIIGSTVHALLDAASGGAGSASLRQRAHLLLRAAAFSGKALQEAVQEAVAAVENSLRDPHGSWILRQRADAESEASWTGYFEGALQTLRADRVFNAGAEPLSDGSGFTWIVDYKHSDPSGKPVADFLTHQREQYAPQLARYAGALRAIRGNHLRFRFGLYYPRIPRLDWWAED
ncbi:ATP-dependent exoDNAse (exonuclease V) beta subunit [Silvibacterium bohemicum]|uniref:DNA 3'-5' helicase n=1 Tax=Silvibacterium bohemicum TaxID=1577686 RepID=A0A841JYC0_9BACT|nr:UvrD-helicase domain-containing protein [Silvibacterium bohemicum]MBB6143971.1 ATP-dependent exoDNAse (exonuclease V) beta subunit [Silvibacterium bohemicum]